MRLEELQVKNFRLLSDIKINLEEDITLIVGKNNTGKTSLLEAIKIFATSEDKLSFEDFSQSTYSVFNHVYEKYIESLEPEKTEQELDELEKYILETIPKIQLQIRFLYDKLKDSLIELSEFITDLDSSRNDATVLISFEPHNTLGLLKSYSGRDDEQMSLIKYLQKNLVHYYSLNCYALDAVNGSLREIEGSFKDKLKKVVLFDDIKALRVLDDKKGDRNKTLATGFSKYYHERDKSDANVQAIENSLKDVAIDLKGKYNVVLEKILSDLEKFGASTPIVIPGITIESEFDSESVIKDNIKYYYKHDEIDLPESYNGLGYSNLIYMVLELASFIEKLRNSKEEKLTEFLAVLIEEPEAHMHPQMQQVFISQIKGILSDAKKDGIYVQLVMTTHSSHILSEAGIDSKKGFNRIRYFNRLHDKIEVQDFNSLVLTNEKETFRFLRQYITLHKSDIFFADKVIMVEGTTERMLLPQMIKKVAPSLISQYVSILEVGGAYTHKFKEILDFIQVKTLIITDLDSKMPNGNKCKVSHGENGEVTSNETLKQWLPKKTLITELIACTDEDKQEGDNIRVVYQTEEFEIIGRSFEEAFIIKNKPLILSQPVINENGDIGITKNQIGRFKVETAETIQNSEPYDLAPKGSKSKTNFAFDIMSFPEDAYGNWETPQYIKEGLEWLAGMCVFNIPE